MQIPGVDDDEVYSAVAMLKSFRILMAISASLGFIVTKLDFKNAYVQAPLKKTVYMRHPGGYSRPRRYVFEAYQVPVWPSGSVKIVGRSSKKLSFNTWFYCLSI
jgi:hypothetical protein